MTADEYRTVAGAGQAAFERRGSRFIGYVAPARTVADAEQVIERRNAEYADASHNVPAYRVRADPLREWANDADEPSGSAGKPALTVLQRRELENVVAVVTRYFGGTELGVGRLARAYAHAVTEAVDAAGLTMERPRTAIVATVGYDDSGTVRSILESDGVPFDATYEETVVFRMEVAVADAPAVRDRLRSATSGRVSFEPSPPE